ncbi:MAG: hypothetical protein EOO77_04785 [Oxalobacteraceae bacterium]|nr:MAG: hypothetical protein EOO77_04785 [Oxalobacteraceae bacterium]
MTKSQNVSPLLNELRRLIFAQDSVTHLPTPMLDMSVSNIGGDGMAPAAIVGFQQEIIAVIAEASDAELIAAYKHTDGENDELEAEALRAEIERRNLDI